MSRKLSDAKAKARLLALCDLLESLPAKRFDFSTWGEAKAKGWSEVARGTDLLDKANIAECGTSACALGWCPSLPFAKRYGIKLLVDAGGKYAEFSRGGVNVDEGLVAKLYFGFSDEVFHHLFTPDQDLGDRKGLSGEPSAKRVAKHIRGYVAVRYA